MVRILKKENVKWVSTYPTAVINNACGEEGVENLMMRTDRLAVAVADGYSRCSNGKSIGVCSVQGGMNAVGAHLAYGAIVQAFEDSTPMLCITDGVSPEITGIPRHDLVQIFNPVTKWTGYVNKPNRIPEFMSRAFTYLKSGRPGPVVIQLPAKLGEFDEEQYPYEPVKGWKTAGHTRDVEIALRALIEAKNPVIYVGQGVFYADACDELLKFVELVQAPVMTTLKAKSAFPENHPLSLGVTGTSVQRFLESSDLIFCIGCSLSPGRRYGGFKHQLPGTKRSDIGLQNGKIIVQCTIDPLDLNRYYHVDHAILGDAKIVLEQLILEANRRGISQSTFKKELIAMIENSKKEDLDKYKTMLYSNEKPINPYRVYQELINAIDLQKSCVTHESGSIREHLAQIYPSIVPHGFIGWGTVSPLGFGLGAAIGAKLAYPERQVVDVAGDAGIAFQIGDFEALVRNKIAITTIHINNSGFSGYGPGPWGAGSAPYTASLTSFEIANYAESVKAFGLDAERVTDPDELTPALRRAFKENSSGRPAFLEVICGNQPIRGWLTV